MKNQLKQNKSNQQPKPKVTNQDVVDKLNYTQMVYRLLTRFQMVKCNNDKETYEKLLAKLESLDKSFKEDVTFINKKYGLHQLTVNLDKLWDEYLSTIRVMINANGYNINDENYVIDVYSYRICIEFVKFGLEPNKMVTNTILKAVKLIHNDQLVIPKDLNDLARELLKRYALN